MCSVGVKVIIDLCVTLFILSINKFTWEFYHKIYTRHGYIISLYMYIYI